MNKKVSTFSLKDQLFNKQKVEYISGLIKEVYSDFSDKLFIIEVLEKFPELELTERITHISKIFYKYLPEDFEKSVNILLKSLPENKENWTLDNNFWDFIFAPYSEYIATYWWEYIESFWKLEYKKWLTFCFDALEKSTVNFSCEYSIRYFLNNYEEDTFNKMLEWSNSKNYHVRRLSSEWSRPKLPWWKKINLDLGKTTEILDNLHWDKSRYITRSVANHLNDISKIDAQMVVDILNWWKKKNYATDIDYIISHSTRGLVKSWHKETLELLWYSSNPKITVENFKLINSKITIWESLEFSFDIYWQKDENLIVDYKIYFPNKAWVLKPKVFKIKKIILQENENIRKKHPFKIMTTKALYYWEYKIEIIINWVCFGKKSFDLKD